MKKFGIILVLLLVVSLVIVNPAQAGNARTKALGGVSTLFYDTAQTVYGNPAGLARGNNLMLEFQLKDLDFNDEQLEDLEELKIDQLTPLSLRVKNSGVSYQEFYELAVYSLGYAVELNNSLSVGITANLHDYEYIDAEYTLDGGVLYSPISALDLSYKATNLYAEDWDMAHTVGARATVPLLGTDLFAEADLDFEADELVRNQRYGLEHPLLFNLLFLRAGYQGNIAEDDIVAEDLTYGAGLNIRFIALDVATTSDFAEYDLTASLKF